MNPRTTGILLLVALALGAFVWFYEIEGEEAREEAAAAEKRLFPGLEAEDVQWVQLGTRDGAQATLERGDEGWVLVEPVAFAADAFAADCIASNLADLGSESVLEDPQASEEYGLAEGARVIRFRAGDEEHVLRIGDTTPIGGGSYARVEGRDAVVTIPTFKATSFDKSLADLRERRIVALDTAAVERVEVGWPDGGVTLERVASGDPSPQGEGAAEDAEDAEDEETPAEDDRAWRVVEPLVGRAADVHEPQRRCGGGVGALLRCRPGRYAGGRRRGGTAVWSLARAGAGVGRRSQRAQVDHRATWDQRICPASAGRWARRSTARAGGSRALEVRARGTSGARRVHRPGGRCRRDVRRGGHPEGDERVQPGNHGSGSRLTPCCRVRLKPDTTYQGPAEAEHYVPKVRLKPDTAYLRSG
jgi:hypothetical protein